MSSLKPTTRLQFKPLTGVYEPSGIQRLPDGQFLVIEDEREHPFSLVSIDSAECVTAKSLDPGWFEGKEAFWKLDDLEGLTADSEGWIYAITSHSRNASGDERKARSKLVRFRVTANRVREPKVETRLKAALIATHPVLAKAALVGDVKGGGGLNIEALEMSPDGRFLLVGFRSPLLDGRAIIAIVDNPSAIFEVAELPHISPVLDTLDLNGCGLRGMAYVPDLSGYILIAGPVARESVQFQLWFWSGNQAEGARAVSVAGLDGFEHAEGLTLAVVDGREKLLIVSDDGDRDEGRYGQFLLLDIDQLQIDA